MKKFFSLLLVIININCFAQANKWFVSFSVAPAFLGPSASLKSQMKSQGYGDDAETAFNIFGPDNISYPRGGSVAFLVRGGKQIKDRKSIYFIAGISQKGAVEGFDAHGWSFGWFGGTYGKHINVNYETYQLTAGYMWKSRHSNTKLGFGPSLFFTDYSLTEDYPDIQNHSAFTAGATGTARIPLGKEKSDFGVELVFEGNAALPFEMKGEYKADHFKPGHMNMFSLNMGFAFCFRQ